MLSIKDEKDKWSKTTETCRNCRVPGAVYERCWESFDGLYEDLEYWCKGCGGNWWIDDIDS